MNRIVVISLVLILFVFSTRAYSQRFELKFRQINEEQGLPGNAVRNLYQDSKNIFWFGVEGLGLCKFDGYTHTLYSNDPKDSTSIGNNFIDAIGEDRFGSIWVGTNKGAYRLNRKTGKFKPYLVSGNRNISVTSILVDSLGRIWLGTKRGLFKYNSQVDSFEIQQLLKSTNPQDLVVYGLSKERGSTFWISSFSNGLVRYNPDNNYVKQYSHDPANPYSLKDDYVASAIFDGKGRIWVCTLTGIGWLDINTGKYHNYEGMVEINNAKFIPQVMMYDSNAGLIWLGGISLTIIDAVALRTIHLPREVTDLFINNDIRFILKDRAGSILIATKFKGLFIYNPQSNTFPHWGERSNDIAGLSDRVVVAANEDDEGKIWIGTRNGGLNRFDPQTNQFKYYQINPKTDNAIKENYTTNVTKGEGGILWVSTLNYLERLDYRNNKFSHYSMSQITALLTDSRHKLWIGSRQGLSFFDPRTNKINFDSEFRNLFPGFQNKEISVIFEDKDKSLWIGWQSDGLIRYNPYTHKGEYFAHSDKDTSSLSDNSVRSIYQDSKGRMWVGTKLRGLNLFEPKSGKFTFFDKTRGFPSNSIYHILEDSSGNLWIGTHNGLVVFNPETRGVQVYTSDYGLQSNIFIQRAFCMCKSGQLFMGGNNGFNLFRPTQIKKRNYQAPLLINSVKVFNKVLDADVSADTSYKLNYQDNYLAFDFSLLDYASTAKNTYKYRMSNIDRDWVSAGNRHYISYSELKPGTYTFELKAANSEGVWSNEIRRLTFEISSPWWFTWWAQLLGLTLVILSIYSLYFYRVSLLKRRETDLQKLVQTRTEELIQTNNILLEQQTRLEEQSEELRMSNEQLIERQARIQEQSEELRTYADSLEEANDNLTKRQELIEIQSDQLKETNHQLEVLNASKDKFFSIIAHDLRNPFYTVTGFSDLILRGLDNPNFEKIRKYADLIHSSAIHGNNLLDNLLQWSRSQTGQMSFEPKWLNLSMLINDTLLVVEGTALQKNITVISYIAPDLTIYADENMLKTVVRNLVSNAIKFTETGGSVTLNAGKLANIIIEISDSGVGMSAEAIQNLFRIDTAVTTKGTDNEAGTGLGLVLCHEFIERHGGKIMVESELGKGSTFRIYLPV